MKVIVIGGGAAGMMAAISAAEEIKNKKMSQMETSPMEQNEVTIFEKMGMLGKKLLITGKGRCNITSSLDIEEFIKNIPGNGMFLYSAFQQFDNKDIINLLKEQGLEVKEERGNRIFPVTDKSVDVLECFKKKLKQLGVEIKLNTKVNSIIIKDGQAIGVKTQDEEVLADKIIIATGGKSYPLTGSDGNGYELAKQIGHTVTDIRPSLVPLEIYEQNLCKELQGLSLRNVKIKIFDTNKNKLIYDDFGEMLFTHFGVSGPIMLSSSAHLVRYKGIEELFKNKSIKLYIDFKPALTYEQLDKRILRDFEEAKNKQFKNSLDKLLPKKLINIVIKKTGIDENKKINEVSKKERENLCNLLKNFEIEIKKFRPIEEAIITSGGINIKEINPKTMESKLVKNLFFAGEIIDVDAYTGGFNLQIAFSTGYVAGNNMI